MRALLPILLTLALAPTAAFAAESPRAGDVDPRIQSVAYDPDQVIVLRGGLGYQLMIEFGPGERLENVSIGDSLGWQVTPNKKANLLFLKPLSRTAVTNMTVVTNQRRYAFDLRVAPKGTPSARLPYVVRFVYPQIAQAYTIPSPPKPDPMPVAANRAYTLKGSDENRPAQVFDDGRMTYFAWAPNAAMPAIFAVSASGAESIVNYGVRQGFTVVEQVAPRFVLRNGKQVTTVINQAYVSPTQLQASR